MREITIDQAAAAVADDAAIVDVREPIEYREGHIPGAVNIPTGQLPSRVTELDPQHPVYVVCGSGYRSATVTEALTAAGFDAVNVAGGTSAWIRSGRPLEK